MLETDARAVKTFRRASTKQTSIAETTAIHAQGTSSLDLELDDVCSINREMAKNLDKITA